MAHVTIKYLGNPGLILATLRPIRDAKEPLNHVHAIQNIELVLNIMDRIKNAKSQILADCEKKTLLQERMAKYYDAKVITLEEDSGIS